MFHMKNTFTSKTLVCSAIAAAGFALSATNARSAAVFTETAGDSFYDSGWSGGSSQPANFGWFLATTTTDPGFAGHFMGDSTTLAGESGGGDINTVGRSWGMFAGSGGSGFGQSDAYGFLKDGSGNDAALSLGQTLSLDLAVNFRNGYKGVAMRDAGGAELFTFNIGGDDYQVLNATTGSGSIGSDYNANTVFHVAVTQTSAGGGTWEITRSGGISDYDTGTYSGLIANFKLYVGQTDGGDANNLMVNNVSVVPEPGAAGLLLIGSGLLLFRRNRR
ncbi:MAG: PEP-CTERM sorting domain-containing protein [Akkermansiaceae bacterium]|nr:PEP-CTERM sorting domain-containing protein [Akkermansiaceae bacterium]